MAQQHKRLFSAIPLRTLLSLPFAIHGV